MDEPASITSMNEQDRQISEIVCGRAIPAAQFHPPARARSLDAEDIVQEVFYELVEANRLLMPIDHVTGWLFRVARNRITDLFRKKRPESFSDAGRRGRRRRTAADRRSLAIARCRAGSALRPQRAAR